MSNFVKWLRWPENKKTGVLPWFVIGWRLLWWPLILGGKVISCVGVALAYGLAEAGRDWRNAW